MGGISEYLNGLRTKEVYTNFKSGVEQSLNRIPYGNHLANQLKKTKSGIKQLFIPGMFFEDMGVTYLGPVDGHDIRKLLDVLKKAKRVKGAVLVHVLTKKGKGYEPAERHPARFTARSLSISRQGCLKTAGKRQTIRMSSPPAW